MTNLNKKKCLRDSGIKHANAKRYVVASKLDALPTALTKLAGPH